MSDTDQRYHFSDVIRQATELYSDLNSSVFGLINALTVIGSSFNIGNDVLSTSAQSIPLSLFFMQRHFRTHENDKYAIERMLSLYTRIRMNASVRGLLVRKTATIGSEMAAKWSELLGEY